MMMVVMLLAVTMMVMAMVPTEMSGQTEAEEDLVEMCKKNSKPHRQRLCLCRRWEGTQNGIPISYFLQNILRKPEIDLKENFLQILQISPSITFAKVSLANSLLYCFAAFLMRIT